MGICPIADLLLQNLHLRGQVFGNVTWDAHYLCLNG